MATFINVTSGGDELLNQAKRQQQAARWAHGQQAQREGLANDKAKQGLVDQQGKGLEPLPYRRDLAALQTTGGLSCARFDQGMYSDDLYRQFFYFSIADAERIQVASEEYRLQGQANYSLGGVMLPIGTTTGILAYPIQYGAAFVLKTVVVGQRKARLVSPPSGLLEKIRHLQSDLAYTENKWTLARQFGIHPSNLQPGAYQYSARFTPAIYTLLGGDLDDETTERLTTYATMRSSYFSSAPRLYLRNDYENQTSTLVRHKVTTAEPPNANYVIPPETLRVNSAYNVRVNAEGIDCSAGRPSWPSGGVVPPANPITNVTHYFAWDWGKPSYCRQQLLALGFSPADLVP